MTKFTSAIRLMKALVNGAKSGVKHELNVMTWEKEWQEEFQDYSQNEEIDMHIYEASKESTTIIRTCVCCEETFPAEDSLELMCALCAGGNSLSDDYHESCSTKKHCGVCSSVIYLHRNYAICDCDLPF